MKKILILIFPILIFAFCNKKSDESNILDPLKKYYQVTASSLIIRSEPKVNSDKVGSVLKNRLIERISNFKRSDTIENNAGNWIKISTLNKKTGYVFDAYLKSAKPHDAYWTFKTNNELIPCSPNYNKCIEKIAKSIFINHKDVLKKEPYGISIRALDGTIIKIRDVKEPKGSIINNKPIAVFLESRYILINVSFYEGGEILLIDRKSKQIVKLWDFPLLSPDKKHLLVTSAADAYATNGVAIVALTENQPKIIYSAETSWYPCKPSWSTANIAIIHKCHVDHKLPDKKQTFLSQIEIKINNDKVKLIQ